MWLLRKIIFLYLIVITWALKQRECKPNTIQAEEQKVKTYLFSNYDATNPPCANKTTVDFLIYPKTITFNEHSNTLEIHCLSITNWNDDRLVWDGEKFNLSDDSFHVADTEIWIPDISVHTSGDLSLDQRPSATYCLLFHTGVVWCKSSVVYTVMCYTDYTAWPFDIQYCDVQLGSWAHDSTVLNLTTKWTNWMWRFYTPNPQWDVVYNKTGITYTKNKYNWEKKSYILWIQMGLKRRSNIMQVFYITPAIVLMILTLASLWLDSISTERLVFVCINFICHLLCIQDLQWKLPSNGQAAPLILLYYENSLLLAAFSLLLTVILAKLEKSNTKVPQFLMSITNNILNSKIGKLLFINMLDPKAYSGLKESDDSILLNTIKKENSWKWITIFISWIAFIIISIIYIILLIIYLPRDFLQINVDHFETRLRKFSKSDDIIGD
ncbi:acetylcholine receptor subunit beta-type acr-3-like [Leptopilina boulardi]|uniref:acetylcholine receptor subunit beta-type acr-3-like n=1 Tax=Leptopilina boulardi TaxID=63433 RepID=UPI0021F5B98A|nr:acetylcholine receptor subunit beta-type acr-3-like [Leptopilina boulardi]